MYLNIHHWRNWHRSLQMISVQRGLVLEFKTQSAIQQTQSAIIYGDFLAFLWAAAEMKVVVNYLNSRDPNFTQTTQKRQEHLVVDIIKLYFIQNGRVVNGNQTQLSQNSNASGYFLAYFMNMVFPIKIWVNCNT